MHTILSQLLDWLGELLIGRGNDKKILVDFKTVCPNISTKKFYTPYIFKLMVRMIYVELTGQHFTYDQQVVVVS